MKWNEVFCNTFKALRPQPSDIRHQIDFILPSMPMVEACRADDFDFFKPLINSGDLTIEQMHHAAERYFLGKTISGKPIFWMMDDMLTPLDARIGTTWISERLKGREPFLEYWQVQHCLFGLHLLTEDDTRSVCVVEREDAAVILSELFPESIWMAYVSTPHLTLDLLVPLDGRTVTIYPRTDPTMSTYMFFLDFANLVRRSNPAIDLHIDPTLEDHATEDQKDRCIDILEFLLESLPE